MRPSLVAALLAALAAAGCATPLIHRGAIRPDPLRAVTERTAARWGIALADPVPAEVIERAQVPVLLRELIDEEWVPGELAAYQETVTSVGLWPDDRDLLEELLAVSEEELAGLYAPTRRQLYVVSDAPVPFYVRLFSALARRDLFWEMILAHEIVHALQHEAYPQLMDGARWRGQDDAAAAALAAIEGDAVRYGLAALDAGALPDPEDFRERMERDLAWSRGALAKAPSLLRLTLLFPYVGGYRLSLDEGRELLDAPPASTEQVLHPTRRREPFLAVDLAPLRGALPDGCRPVGENGMGELGVSVLLRDLGGAGAPARAWQGWDGDRYLVVHCDGRREFVWLTAWDSEGDAREFEAAYLDIDEAVRARAGLGAPLRVRRSGREVHVLSDGLAALAEALNSLPRRTRLSTLTELRAHFGRGDAGSGDVPAGRSTE